MPYFFSVDFFFFEIQIQNNPTITNNFLNNRSRHSVREQLTKNGEKRANNASAIVLPNAC